MDSFNGILTGVPLAAALSALGDLLAPLCCKLVNTDCSVIMTTNSMIQFQEGCEEEGVRGGGGIT